MIHVRTSDLGYQLVFFWRKRVLIRFQLPIPLSIASLKYLWRNRRRS